MQETLNEAFSQFKALMDGKSTVVRGDRSVMTAPPAAHDRSVMTAPPAAVGVDAVDAVTHPAPPPLSAAAGCAVRMARSTDRWVVPYTGGQVDRADRHYVRAG